MMKLGKIIALLLISFLFSFCSKNKIDAENTNLTSKEDVDFKELLNEMSTLRSRNVDYLPVELGIRNGKMEIVGMSFKDNNLNEFPKGILKFYFLEKLDLSSNYLTELPNGINNLKFLKHIDLSNNEFESIPNLKELKLDFLFINDNKINGEVDLSKSINRVNHLGLNRNDISNFNNFNEIEIESIWIGHNKFMNLEGIKSIVGLEYINAIDNKISKIECKWFPATFKTLVIEDNIKESANCSWLN